MPKRMIVIQSTEGERAYEVVTIPTWLLVLILGIYYNAVFVWPKVAEIIFDLMPLQ
jgi:hypothetical protein